MTNSRKTIRSTRKTTTRATKVRTNSARQKRRTSYHAKLGQPTKPAINAS